MANSLCYFLLKLSICCLCSKFHLQINDLVDIARCGAEIDLSEDGSHEFLIACMHDLQDLFQHSKYAALLVDTFGGRIENLLR